MPRTVLPFDPASVRHVLQRPQVDEFLGALGTHDGIVVLDLETTGLNEHWAHARVVTLSATLPRLDEEGEEVAYPLTYVVGLSHPDAPLHHRWREELRRIALAINSYGLPIIGQNVRFDVRWITALTGVDLGHLVLRDTGLSSHLLDENYPSQLKPRAMQMFGIDKWIDFDWGVIEKQQMKDPRYPFCPLLAERVDYFTMAMYNARDTYWTWRLDQIHCLDMGLLPSSRDELMAMGDRDSTDMLRIGSYYQTVGLPMVRTLIDLEQTGMKIDVKWCHDRLATLDGIVNTNLEKLRELWFQETSVRAEDFCKERGVLLSFEPTALFFQEWARVMCAVGKMRVLGITPEGVPSWTKEILDRLTRMGYEAAAVLRAYKKASKEAQFIRAWFERIGEDDRIHPTYNYYRVVTGRLSSSDPNAQQIPKSAKDAFCASEGNMLVTADYSQIELRVAAYLAQCQPMIQAFQEGKDLHRTMAAMVARVPYEEVTAEQRQRAKAANFGFLFGMGAEKFVKYADDLYGVSFTDEEAEAIRAAFFDTWVGMGEWHEAQRKYAERYGYVKSPLGRMRRLPAIHSSDNYRRSEAARQAINSPVQSLANDMMILSASKIRNDFPQIKPIALVHDAILCEVPAEQVRSSALAIKATMENRIQPILRRLGCDFPVPLVADVAVGTNWGSCQELEAA